MESEVAPSGITGYRKGKVPEKHVCTNCLRKGIKCKEVVYNYYNIRCLLIRVTFL